MKRVKGSPQASTSRPPAAPPRVSLQAIYADALREVMADPGKAISKYDPSLATLLPGVTPLPAKG